MRVHSSVFDSPASLSRVDIDAVCERQQVKKNHGAYGLSGSKLSEQAVEKVLKDQLILTNVRELAKHGLVSNRLP